MKNVFLKLYNSLKYNLINFKHYHFKYNFGFTLYEVLIIMVVLGIIAAIMAITVKPQEYQDKILLAHAQKLLNDIDDATKAILANDSLDGTMHRLITPDWTATEFDIDKAGSKELTDKLAGLYKKYLTVSRKECNDDSCSCYTMSGSPEKTAAFYLKNGACISMNQFGYHLSGNTFIFPGETTRTSSHGIAFFRFDVNGSKGPNEYGKDRFNIPLGEKGILWNDPDLSN